MNIRRLAHIKVVTYVVTIVLFSIQSAVAQFNIKTGFVTLYTPATEHNNIVSEFNSTNEYRLQNPMPDLHFLNGLQVGANYQIGDFALDLTWENVLRKRVGNGEDPATNGLFQKEYFYNINALSIALESAVNRNIRFSVGIGRRRMRIRRNINGSKVKIDIFEQKQHQYFATAKLVFILSPDANIPLAIAPYFTYPLSDLNLSDYRTDLGLEAKNQNDRFASFGLAILYYYGSGF